MHGRTVVAMAAVMSLVAGAASAGILNFGAILRSGYELPPNASYGRGDLTAQVDTRTGQLDYTVSFTGLSGTPTAARFEGTSAGKSGRP